MPRIQLSAKKNDISQDEELALIQTNLLLHNKEARVISLVSSHCSKEEMLFAQKLSEAFAKGQHKVLLVCACGDADLPSGFVENNSAELGFLDFLKGKCSCDECLFETKVDGLMLMTAGKETEDSAGLWEGRQVETAIAALRERFDYIFVLLPALTIPQEVVAVGNMDGSIILLQPGESFRKIAKGYEMIRREAPILGCVFVR